MHIDNPTRTVNEIWNPIDRPEIIFQTEVGVLGALNPLLNKSGGEQWICEKENWGKRGVIICVGTGQQMCVVI